jgi:hypothetical protein
MNLKKSAAKRILAAGIGSLWLGACGSAHAGQWQFSMQDTANNPMRASGVSGTGGSLGVGTTFKSSTGGLGQVADMEMSLAVANAALGGSASASAGFDYLSTVGGANWTGGGTPTSGVTFSYMEMWMASAVAAAGYNVVNGQIQQRPGASATARVDMNGASGTDTWVIPGGGLSNLPYGTLLATSPNPGAAGLGDPQMDSYTSPDGTVYWFKMALRGRGGAWTYQNGQFVWGCNADGAIGQYHVTDIYPVSYFVTNNQTSISPWWGGYLGHVNISASSSNGSGAGADAAVILISSVN